MMEWGGAGKEGNKRSWGDLLTTAPHHQPLAAGSGAPRMPSFWAPPESRSAGWAPAVPAGQDKGVEGTGNK